MYVCSKHGLHILSFGLQEFMNYMKIDTNRPSSEKFTSSNTEPMTTRATLWYDEEHSLCGVSPLRLSAVIWRSVVLIFE